MTMRATRDARPVVPSPPCAICTHDHCECLRRQVNYDAAVEAVVEAARATMDAAPNLMSDTPFAHRLNDLHAALARLDALTDGQTAGDGERVETASDNASLTPSEGDPVPAPAACPCDGTDCVC